MSATRRARRGWFLALSLLVLPPAARADLFFNYSINTTPLTGLGAPPKPFYVEFEFLDGSSPATPGNNTAVINTFAFGGGGPAGAAFLGDGVKAGSNIASFVTMTDALPSANLGFFQPFNPGSTLSFSVHLTTVPEAPAPDEFTFAILDSSLSEIPTLDPSTANKLLRVDVTSTTLTLGDLHTYNTDASQTFPSAPTIAVPSLLPIGVTPAAPPAIPEPATLTLLALGLSGLAARRWLTRRTAA